MRDCPTGDDKNVVPNVPKDDVLKGKAHFYALRARGSKTDEVDYDDCKF